MVKINIYAVIKRVTRIWLSIEVEEEMAREVGTKYVALAVATDPRVTDAWWDYAKVDNPLRAGESEI